MNGKKTNQAANKLLHVQQRWNIFQRKYYLVFAISVALCCYLAYTSSLTWRITVEDFPNATDEPLGNLFIKSIPRENISCHLPMLKPFDDSIKEFVQTPEPANCQDQYPLLFKTDTESNLIQLQNMTSFGYEYCCYQKFERDKGRDKITKLDHQCMRIKENLTKIPDDIEFIRVSCLEIITETNKTWRTVDMFGFVHLKPAVEERIASIKKRALIQELNATNATGEESSEDFEKPSTEEKPTVNVVILGLDAVSHMNFIRTMPLTYEYLTKNLSAQGMFGYTKVGDNTFPNIVPALMGKLVEEISEDCWKDDSLPFDDCPFIWKNYSAQGYRTAYGEDAVWMGIFNYAKRGFNEQPTDYYSNAFTYQLEAEIGHHELVNAKLCYGPRFGFELPLDFLKKMASTMDKSRRYFQFVWATSMFHDNLNEGMRGDQILLETLQWFKNGGYLEDTVFILMSDHGIRWGDILSTLQGRLEERMPFLYFIFPEWFKVQYRSAVSNLIRNKYKLTSPFDLYETLVDLLSLKSLDKIQERYNILSVEKPMPRGMSLFLPIPSRRTCKDAGIGDHWCVCRSLSTMPVENNTLVREGAENVVVHINGMFEKFPQCLPLTLSEVLSAEVLQSSNNEVEDHSNVIQHKEDSRLKTQQVTFTMSFKVAPSNGLFEATAIRETDGRWTVSTEISRINLYGDQSTCVSDYNLKKFCYCG